VGFAAAGALVRIGIFGIGAGIVFFLSGLLVYLFSSSGVAPVTWKPCGGFSASIG
jgi:hypothetical protein